uniref:Uncharacterized protein n=1 Tax=Panagrolaimus superbus TaxID=310955 RepID=A0A914YGH2_9BILA
MKEAAKLHYNDADRFFSKFSDCLKTHIPINDTQLDFFNNRVNDENKVFLTMAEGYQQKTCKWLTAGIGGSSRAEELVLNKYSNCEIYGVDPTNVGNFSKIGKVLPFGVGKCK